MTNHMTSRVAALSTLHHKMEPVARAIHQDLKRLHKAGQMEFAFEVFETFRFPQRQAHLLTTGATKAGPWQSAHQVGLAVDFVPYLTAAQAKEIIAQKGGSPFQGWYWPGLDHPDWRTLAGLAEDRGMNRISWDGPHVEHPLFQTIRAHGF